MNLVSLTIPDLCDKMDITNEEAGLGISAGSASWIIASVIMGIVIDHLTSYFDLIMGVCYVLLGVFALLKPFMPTLWAFILVMFLEGFVFATIDPRKYSGRNYDINVKGVLTIYLQFVGMKHGNRYENERKLAHKEEVASTYLWNFNKNVVSCGAVPSAASSYAAMRMVAGSLPVLVIVWEWHIDLALLCGCSEVLEYPTTNSCGPINKSLSLSLSLCQMMSGLHNYPLVF